MILNQQVSDNGEYSVLQRDGHSKQQQQNVKYTYTALYTITIKCNFIPNGSVPTSITIVIILIIVSHNYTIFNGYCCYLYPIQSNLIV